jgi:2-hydroxychromene-2-carboxylate isomerase
MPQTQFDCWITLGSTYTYLTVLRAGAVAERTGVRLRFRPFNLLVLFRERDYFPFPPDQPKTRYMWQDLERRAALHDIPLRLPVPYPAKQSIVANRVALVGMQEGWGDAFIAASYRRWFQAGEEPGSEPNLSGALRDIGQDPARVKPLADSAATEQALVAATDTARSLGIFGAPTFVVGDQLFWGDDRLEDAISWLKHGRVVAA